MAKCTKASLERIKLQDTASSTGLMAKRFVAGGTKASNMALEFIVARSKERLSTVYGKKEGG